MAPTPRPSRWFWILVPLGFGSLLALAILVLGGARRADAADLGAVTDTLSGGVSVVPAPAQPVTDVVAPLVGVADPVVGVAAPVVDPVVGVASPVVDPVVGVASPVVDPVLGVVAPVVGPVLGVVGPVVDPVLGVVAPVVAPMTGVVDPPIPRGSVTPPVVGPGVGTVDPVATPAVEPLVPVVGRVVPPIGAAALLPIRPVGGTQPPDVTAGITPSPSVRSDAVSITLDPAPSPSDLPTLPPDSNEPFAPLLSSASASGGVPFQLLLFAVAVALAGFLGSRARRLLLLGAIAPRFAAVSLSARPG